MTGGFKSLFLLCVACGFLGALYLPTGSLWCTACVAAVRNKLVKHTLRDRVWFYFAGRLFVGREPCKVKAKSLYCTVQLPVLKQTVFLFFTVMFLITKVALTFSHPSILCISIAYLNFCSFSATDYTCSPHTGVAQGAL